MTLSALYWGGWKCGTKMVTSPGCMGNGLTSYSTCSAVCPGQRGHMWMGFAVQHGTPHDHAGMFPLDGSTKVLWGFHGSNACWWWCQDPCIHTSALACSFRSDENVKSVMVQWFQQQPREFFAETHHWLVPQCDASLNIQGYYFSWSLFLCPEQSPHWSPF
jgi:hypothetical protein